MYYEYNRLDTRDDPQAGRATILKLGGGLKEALAKARELLMYSPWPTPVRYSHRVVAPIVFLAACLSGCSKSPPLEPLANGDAASSGTHTTVAAASGYGSASFYPLAIGNTWTYEGGGTTRILQGDGGPRGQEFSYAFTEAHRLIGTTRLEGTAYVVEEQVHHEIPESYYGPFTWWDRLRQDPKGLFSLDTLLQEPPILEGSGSVAAAAASRTRHPYRIDIAAWRRDGAADALLERFADRVEVLRELARGITRRGREPAAPAGLELRRLVYPLRPGTSWSIRPDFPWPARVDGVEVLNTPAGRIPAYRIEINPFGDPLKEGEWVRVWFSREGYLGYSIHAFTEGTNQDGEPTGITYVIDDWMKVTSVRILR